MKCRRSISACARRGKKYLMSKDLLGSGWGQLMPYASLMSADFESPLLQQQDYLRLPEQADIQYNQLRGYCKNLQQRPVRAAVSDCVLKPSAPALPSSVFGFPRGRVKLHA